MPSSTDCKRIVAEIQDKHSRFYQGELGLGALKDLQQAVTHPWAYVAELLQNAVDTGARRIRFAADENTFVFEHDGKAFSAGDVKGICARGVSQKSTGTVGFMGVGFKSVFQAFQRVAINSGGFQFALEVPVVPRTLGAQIPDWRGAVVPRWDPSAPPPEDGMHCCFTFSGRRENRAAVTHDLESVFGEDHALLPLLAMRGVDSLDCNGQVWWLTKQELSWSNSNVKAYRLEAESAQGEQGRRAWLLLSLDYHPTDAAACKLVEHRQVWSDDAEVEARIESDARRSRQVQLFCELDPSGKPILPQQGKAFAVLPTDVVLPFRLHMQADWLLVITRSEIKDLEANLWHDEIRAQIPTLLAAFLRWLVEECAPTGPGWEGAYDCLPDFGQATSDTARWLLHPEFRQALRSQLEILPFLPTYHPSRFLRPTEGALTPKPFQPFETTEWRPALLLGECVVSRSSLPVQALRALETLELLTELDPVQLNRYWGDHGVSDWVNALDEEQQLDGVIRLLAALRATEKLNPAWKDVPFRSIPTEEGGWIARTEAVLLPEDWHILKPHPGIADLFRTQAGSDGVLVQLSLLTEIRKSDWTEPRERRGLAKEYLSPAEATRLEDLAKKWWDSLPLSPDASQIEDVLRVTWWVRKDQGNRTNLIHKVLCESDDGTGVLLPPNQALLTDPYAPSERRLLFARVPAILSQYLNEDPHEGSQAQWRSFWEGFKPQGSFQLHPGWKSHSKQEISRLVNWSTGNPPENYHRNSYTSHSIAGLLHYTHYLWIDASLPENWPDFNDRRLDVILGMAVGVWLADALEHLHQFRSPRIDYVGARSRQIETVRVSASPRWIQQLEESPWIPAHNSDRLWRPGDVLTSYDEVRPDAPVSVLPTPLVEVLTQAGMRFGRHIQEAPSRARLEKEGPKVSTERLLELVKAAIDEAGEETEAREELERLFHNHALLPSTSGLPVVHNRIVRRAGKGSLRSDLGKWLTAQDHFDQGSPEWQVFECVNAFLPFPLETTGVQALAYLRYVWETPLPAEQVGPFVRAALSYVAEDMGTSPALKEFWTETVPTAKVYTRQRQWLLATGVYFHDLDWDVLAYDASLSQRFPIATPSHLGRSRADQEKAMNLLGLRRLSEVIRVEPRTGQISGVPTVYQNGIRQIWTLVQEFRHAQVALEVETDGEEENEVTSTGDPTLLTWYRTDDLGLRIVVDGQTSTGPNLMAIRVRNTLYVQGQAPEFAGDLGEVLAEWWRIDRRGALVAQITHLLALLDTPAAFDISLQRIRVKLGLDQLVAAGLQDEQQDRGPEWKPLDPTANPKETSSGIFHGSISRNTTDGVIGFRAPSEGGFPSDGLDNPPGNQNEHFHGNEKGPSGPYTRNTVLDLVRRYMDVGLQPDLSDDDGGREQDTSGRRSDHIYREAAATYERQHGREPRLLDDNQPGHDIASYRGDRLDRLIEVKGRERPWTGDEIVTLSAYQFRTHLLHNPAVESADYWLYVVHRNGVDLVVTPIKNPARLAARFELPAGLWRHFADVDE